MRNKLRNIWLCSVGFLFITTNTIGQCEVFDYYDNSVTDPIWYACQGTDYTLNLYSPNNWTSYTIDWGDGSPLESGTDWDANSILPHFYPLTVQEFTIVISNPDLGCSITGTLIMEEPTTAGVVPPVGTLTVACAPHTVQFENLSNNVSPNTVFEFDFGDGSPIVTFDHTNAGQIIDHTYEENTVDCQTAVTLYAYNQCNIIQGGPAISTWEPIKIFDIDDASITPSSTFLCFPDNEVVYTNSTERNCLAEGNDGQRYEYWNFGDYWGTGQDSIVDWTPWPPINPYTIEYPGNLGDVYEVMMIDSSFCGLDTAYMAVTIVAPPTADIAISDPLVCVADQVSIEQNYSGAADYFSYQLGNNTDWITLYSPGDVNYTYYEPGNYTITSAIGVEASPACADTAYATVQVLPVPEVTILADNLTGCGSLTVNFAESSTDTDTWIWDFGNGNTFNGPNPPAQTYSAVGDYVITLTASNAAGCANTVQEVVSLFEQPQVDFIANNVCEGTDAQFTDLSISDGGDPIITWDWQFGDGNTSIDEHPVHQYGPPGSYNATLEVSTINCNASLTLPIIVEAAPEPIFDVDVTGGCAPLDVSFTNSSINSDSYTWDFGDQSGSFADNPEHTFYNFSTADTVYTVVMTASSNFGCFQRDSIEISVSPGAQASFTTNAQPPGCAPFSAIFTNTSYGATNYEWDFGDGSSTNTSENPIHVYQNTTGFIQTYDVQLIAFAINGCNDTIVSTITVFPEPDFTFDAQPADGCSPLVVSMPLIASAQSFDWDFGDGQTSQIPNPTHLYTNNTGANINYTITLNAVSAFGCAGTSTSEIVVYPAPEVNFSLSEFSGCSPLEIDLTDASVGATSGEYNFGDGNTQTYAGSTSHTFVNNTGTIQTYDVSLYIENDQGCSAELVMPVEVTPSANPEILPPEDGCSPYNLTLLNNSTNATSFLWDFGNGFTSNLNNGNTTFINNSGTDTTYTVSLTAFSGLGCDQTVTEEITIYSSPISSFTTDVSSGCSVVSVEFTNNSMGANTYSWDYGDGNISNTALNNHFHEFENYSDFPIDYLVSLTVTNNIGCSDYFELPITVYPQITAEFEQEENGCSPLAVSFDNESFGSDTEFTWNFGDGNSSSSSNPTHTFLNNSLNDTTFTVELVTTSIYGCQDIYQQNITVFGTPQANLAIANTEGCYPLNVTFNNTSEGADSYSWAYGTGETSNEDSEEHTHTFYNLDNSSVTYLVSLTAFSNEGCQSSEEVFVEVHPLLNSDFSSVTEGCSPLAVQFENESEGALSHTWYFDDGSAPVNQLHPNHIFTNDSDEDLVYTVMLVSESYAGCTDTSYTDILVHPVPFANFSVDPLSQTFPNVSVNVTNESIGGSSLSYVWDFGDNTAFANEETPEEHAYETWGNYIISLEISNGFCSANHEQEIEIIPPPPVAQFEGPAEGCEPLTVTFTNQSEYGISYLWDFGDGGQAFVANPVYTYQTPGTYSVRLIATGHNNGETNEILREDIITVHPRAVAAFSVAPNEVSVPSQPIYTVNFSENASEFSWDFGDGNTSSEENPEYFYQFEGLYDITLWANNEFNCPDSLTQHEAVLATSIGSLEFPNAFTPSGEIGGEYDPQSFNNDVFFPIQQGVEEYQLLIYNKWGELLFESKNINIGWDGTYQGKLVKQDVYIWKANAKFSDGTEHTQAGDVTLLR